MTDWEIWSINWQKNAVGLTRYIHRFKMQGMYSLLWQAMLQHSGGMPNTGQICSLDTSQEEHIKQELWLLGGGITLAGFSSNGTEYKNKHYLTKTNHKCCSFSAWSNIPTCSHSTHSKTMPCVDSEQIRRRYGWVLVKIHLHNHTVPCWQWWTIQGCLHFLNSAHNKHDLC